MTLSILAGGLVWVVAATSGNSDEEATNMAGVTVADDVLEQGEPWFENGEVTGRTTSPAFLVSPASSQAAIDSVLAAAKRFYAINEFGEEVSEDDPAFYDYYTPTFVAAYRTAGGVALVADTKGDFPLVQGQAMVAVLTEELTARHVTAHVEALPPGSDLSDEIGP